MKNINFERNYLNRKDMKKLVLLFSVVLSVSMFSCGNAKLSPNWSEDATDEQRRLIGSMIDSMILVEGGTFSMGAQKTDPNGINYDSYAKKEESPVHQVTLSDYYIGKYEVTQDVWEAVMGNNPSRFKGNKKPVECISWNDCQEFVLKLQALTGLKFGLPTEAQWEYAARGGNKSMGYKYSGSNSLDDIACYSKYFNIDGHKEVGSKQPNELGIYDMIGNVWEWCNDYYNNYCDSIQTDPIGPNKDKFGASYRVYRGGGWANESKLCRVSCRGGYVAGGVIGSDVGLRLVINPN